MRYSLRSLFAAVALAALIVFSLSRQQRPEVGVAFCFVTLLIPAILAAGIVNGGRDTRTFCIGAISCAPFEVAYLVHSLRGQPMWQNAWVDVLEYVATNNLRHVIGAGWIMMAVMGTLSVLCGRLFWPKPSA